MKMIFKKTFVFGLTFLIVLGIFFQAAALEIDSENINSAVQNGQSAYVEDFCTGLSTDVITQVDSPVFSYKPYENIKGLYFTSLHGEWMSVPELHNFFDCKGYYNISYASGKKVYIHRYDYNTLKKLKVITTKQVFPLLGEVLCDNKGYYYVITGKNTTTKENAKINVSKYDYNGKEIKSITQSFSSGKQWNTAYPFIAGTCVAAINKGILLCNYARRMYNDHQSSSLLQVNTSKMKFKNDLENNGYSVTYTSHSFAQDIFVDSKGRFNLCDLGDAYPRAVKISRIYKDKTSSGNSLNDESGYGVEKQNVFHFYGQFGDNYTGAQLGGIAEGAGGVILCGSSKKSLTKSSLDETMNIFVTLAFTDKKLRGAESREGTSGDNNVTDENILWLTDYQQYNACNPQMTAIDNDKFIIMWEKMNSIDKKFIDSFYMIINANGEILQNPTSLNKIRLNACEKPLYKDGYLIWTTAGHFINSIKRIKRSSYSGSVKTDARDGVIHKLKIGSVIKAKKCGSKKQVGNVTYKIINAAEKGGRVRASKIDFTKASEITIPDSININTAIYKITKLPKSAFANRKKTLKKVTLGKNITVIPDYCFRYSKSIKEIVINSTKLKSSTVGKKAFEALRKNVKIKVPKSKINEYKKIFRQRGLNKKTKVYGL